jgi:hypothetical protein
MRNRPDGAWAVTSKLHGSPKAHDAQASLFAKEEFYQMSHQVAVDQAMGVNENVLTLFKKPSYRRRMVCAFLTTFGAESTGILVVYSKCPQQDKLAMQADTAPDYSVLLYEGLGFKGAIPLLLAAVYVAVACIGNYINSLLITELGGFDYFVSRSDS